MKKRIFKFGAALTAALMICSATAGLAFADEIDAETPDTTEPAAVETVDEAAPEEVAAEEETPAEEAEAPAEDAEDVEEVVVPLETEDITAEDVAEAEAEAAAKADDVATGSAIKIGDITSSSDDSYYTVSVPFSVTNVPSQMTLFVYNITALTSGDQNNTVGFSDNTPVGYINQYPGAEASGTYTFKLSKSGDNAYKDGDIIVVKIGGTDVEIPDAKSYTLTDSAGPAPEVVYGDANEDGSINIDDAVLVLKFAAGNGEISDQGQTNADVNLDESINIDDAVLILKSAAGNATLPAPVQ